MPRIDRRRFLSYGAGLLVQMIQRLQSAAAKLASAEVAQQCVILAAPGLVTQNPPSDLDLSHPVIALDWRKPRRQQQVALAGQRHRIDIGGLRRTQMTRRLCAEPANWAYAQRGKRRINNLFRLK